MTDFQGHVARPEYGDGPAVLVLHAWWGLNENTRRFCDRLAMAGYTVVAPDLYHGKIANTIDQAEKLGSALDANHVQAKKEILTAANHVIKQAGDADSGLTVIGFSLGAYYALDLSTTRPDIVRSVVLFYGSGPADFSKSSARYLGHFADNDPYEPKEQVDALEAALKNAGRSVTFYRYANTGHWFFESDRPEAYNDDAASLAWDRTIAFLSQSTR